MVAEEGLMVSVRQDEAKSVLPCAKDKTAQVNRAVECQALRACRSPLAHLVSFMGLRI
jgi:hypothetical protein